MWPGCQIAEIPKIIFFGWLPQPLPSCKSKQRQGILWRETYTLVYHLKHNLDGSGLKYGMKGLINSNTVIKACQLISDAIQYQGCERWFKSKGGLLGHKFTILSLLQPTFCTLCDRHFNIPGDLETQMLAWQKDKNI